MRKKVFLFLAALASVVVVASAPGAVITQYWSGTATGNDWKLSPSYAVRLDHAVGNYGACLPSNAQFQVANFGTNGAMINTHRSNYGACSFEYPLTSNGLQAKAACRIIVTNAPGSTVSRPIACYSTWQ